MERNPKIETITAKEVPAVTRKGKWATLYEEIKLRMLTENDAVKISFTNEDEAIKARFNLALYGNADSIKVTRNGKDVFACVKR